MSRRFFLVASLLLPALLFGFKLDYAPFWNPDEGRYSATAYEMAFGLGQSAPDWVVPHLNGVTRLNKPPLIYWGAATMFRAFGPSEIAGRLPSALAGIIVLLVLFFWGRAAWNTRAGAGAALVWGTTLFPVAMARVANTDMLLCASIALASCGLFFAIETRRAVFGLLAGAGMGLALLSKGPVGVALPLAVALLCLGLDRKGKSVPWGALALALGVALLLGAPWYGLVEARRPGFLHEFLWAENLSRFSGGTEFHKPSPKWYYLPIIALGMLPWTGFFLASLGQWEPLSTRGGRAKRFAAVWALVITLFFSFSGTKLISYVLPAFPALALWTGASVARYQEWTRGARTLALALTLALNCVAIIAMAIYPGLLLGEKVVPRALGASWTVGIVAVLALGSVLVLLAARRPSGKTMLGAQALGGGALLLSAVFLAQTIARYDDGSALLLAIRPQLQKEDRIAGYLSFAPSAMFYARRPVTFFGFHNSSGLNEGELRASRFFRPASALDAYLNQAPGRAFVIADGPLWPRAARRLHLWGRNNFWFLYASVPKPAAFSFRYVAPGRRERRSKRPPDAASLSPQGAAKTSRRAAGAP